MEDIPARFLSRNSTRLKCEPTVTISSAPFSAAISIATSSLVAGAGTSLYVRPSSLEALAAGRAAVRVGVHHQLGAAAQRGSVAESMSPTIISGLKPSSRIASAPPSTADQHRPHVAHVGSQRPQVLLVVDAAHHHQRRAVAEAVSKSGISMPPGEQLTLLAMCVDRVLGERLDRLADLRAGPARGRGRRVSGSWHLALGERRSSPRSTSAAAHA